MIAWNIASVTEGQDFDSHVCIELLKSSLCLPHSFYTCRKHRKPLSDYINWTAVLVAQNFLVLAEYKQF